MVEIPYRAQVLRRPPRSSNGKVPYVELSDGTIVADSHAIIASLTASRGVILDDALGADLRAQVALLTRMLEDHFYWVVVWDRWAVAEHWPLTRQAYFGTLPVPLRWLVPPIARRGVRAALRGQGFGRMPGEAILERARQDLAVLSQVLGEREAFLGRASSVDATAYAFLSAALRPPFDGPLQHAVARHANLVAFCERMEQRLWS